MQLTGAQIVIECLREQGVDTVFGYPGGAILNVYDELYRHIISVYSDFPGIRRTAPRFPDVTIDA